MLEIPISHCIGRHAHFLELPSPEDNYLPITLTSVFLFVLTVCSSACCVYDFVSSFKLSVLMLIL